jgi:hypothetical protein
VSTNHDPRKDEFAAGSDTAMSGLTEPAQALDWDARNERSCGVRKPKKDAPGLSKNTPKVLIYEALAVLNRHFEDVLLDLKGLAALGIFPNRWQRQFLKACRATLEEARAWANFELVEILHQMEERDWVAFARIRQRRENAGEDSGDVLLPPELNQRKRRRT